jgi:hypothetical protein
MSGLKVNFGKSKLYGVNVNQGFLKIASRFLHCVIESMPLFIQVLGWCEHEAFVYLASNDRYCSKEIAFLEEQICEPWRDFLLWLIGVG